MRSLLLALTAAGACLPPQQSERVQAVEKSAKRDQSKILELALAKMVSPSCNWDDEEGELRPPSDHKLTKAGVTVKQACGLVAVEILEPSWRDKFVSEVCFGNEDDNCDKRYSDMFFARLELRYPLANWKVVERKCRAYPADCRYFIDIEKWTAESHNETVRALAREALTASQKRYRAAWEEAYAQEVYQRQKVGQAMAAFVRGFANPKRTVQCKSVTNAGITNTACK